MPKLFPSFPFSGITVGPMRSRAEKEQLLNIHHLGTKEGVIKKTGIKGFQCKSKPDRKMVGRQKIRGQGRKKKRPNAVYTHKYTHIHMVNKLIVY